MRRLIFLPFAALFLVAFANVPMAHATFRWEHYGTDPFAPSRDEAMAARTQVFESFGFSNTCTQAAYQAMSAPGRVERLNPGDRLAAMMSRGHRLHRDVLVAFAQPTRGVDYSATVEIWEFDCEGRHYKIGLPQVCNNWVLYTAALSPAVGSCPNGYLLVVHAWSLQSLPPDLQRQADELIRAAQVRQSMQATLLRPYRPDAVSRTLGRRLRLEVRTHAPVNADIQVRYLYPGREPAQVASEVGTIHLNGGMGKLQMPGDPRQWVVEIIWPGYFLSPTTSGGEVRLRRFPDEPWLCTDNVHGLVP